MDSKPHEGVTLNDCANGEYWILKAELDNTSNLAIEDGQSSDDCTVLTVLWDNLIHGLIATADGARACEDAKPAKIRNPSTQKRLKGVQHRPFRYFVPKRCFL